MRVFLDANVILDRFDTARDTYSYSIAAYEYLIIKSAEIYTSCDLITTIYYINSKANKTQALHNIQNLLKTIKLIEFSNKEAEQACAMMIENSHYKDLEDTLQYILAKNHNCDMIISNDKHFYSEDIEVLTSREFCYRHEINL